VWASMPAGFETAFERPCGAMQDDICIKILHGLQWYYQTVFIRLWSWQAEPAPRANCTH
jgi:hypothetical protein